MASLINFDYSKIPEIVEDSFNSQPDTTKTYVLISISAFFGLVILYVIWIFISVYLEKKQNIYKLEINFPLIELHQNQEYISSMQAFFNSSSEILAGQRMSFEVHKTDGFISVILTASDQKVLNNLTKLLTSIRGLTITQTVVDPLDYYTKSYAKRIFLQKNLYSISQEETNLFGKLVDFLASIPKQEQGGVMFLVRNLTDKEYQIEKQINKNDSYINQTQHKNTKLEKASQSLSFKLKGKLFLVQIYLIGSTSEITRSLASIFQIQNDLNKFVSKSLSSSNNALKLKVRHITKENLFTGIFRSFFGSYLTSHELALMIHPTHSERGIFKPNKTTIIESSPEFLESGENKLLIGRSHLATGEEKQVFLPTENFRRHLYVLGSTGSGKSTVLIRTALSACKDKSKALIFFDPHEQDLNMIVRRLPDLDDVVYFKFDSSGTDKKITFNPLYSFGTTDLQKDALIEDILNILEQEAKDGDLGISIKKLLKLLISTGVHFADAYYKYLTEIENLEPETAKMIVFERQLTLPDLSYILKKKYGYKKVIETIFLNYKGKNISLKWQNEIDDYLINKGILDGIDNRLSNIVTDSIQLMFEGNSFDIKELIKQNKKILIPISETAFGNISKKMITKLLLAQTWSYVQYSYNPDNEKEKVQIIIDEMQEAESPLLPRMLSEARKYGASLILAHQFIQQVSTKFLNSVLGNVGSMLVFNMGNYEEVKSVVGMFGGDIEPKDISNLPPFQGFLRTIREHNKGRALLSFETMDYRTEFNEVNDEQTVNSLVQTTLDTYGQTAEELYQKRMEKMENTEEYFLFNLQ